MCQAKNRPKDANFTSGFRDSPRSLAELARADEWAWKDVGEELARDRTLRFIFDRSVLCVCEICVSLGCPWL